MPSHPPLASPPPAAAGEKPAGAGALEKELTSIFVDLAGVFGLPRSYGEIYGLLFASAEPLSFTDIQARSQLSKGSISQGLRALREIGAIRDAEGEDLRRDHFAPETEVRQLLGGLLRGSVNPHLRRGRDRLGRLRTQHKAMLAPKTEANRILLSRLDKLESWHRKGATLLPFVAKFLG